MDYEKKYKEALGCARRIYNEEVVCPHTNQSLEEIFPELVEIVSEDERTRRELVKFISDIKSFSERGRTSWAIRSDDAKMCETFLTYLEKQKEQKPDDDPLNDPKFLKGFDTGREVQRIFDEKKPAEWGEDDQLIGFIFDLLNDLVWRKDWAMSKEECLERIKSLRPSWKPSEEQMKALRYAIKQWEDGKGVACPSSFKYHAITELYEQLEKMI